MPTDLSACESVCLPEWTFVIDVCRDCFFGAGPKTVNWAMCELTVGVETLIGGGRSGTVWSTALQGQEWFNSGRGELCPPHTRRQKMIYFHLRPYCLVDDLTFFYQCNCNKERKKCREPQCCSVWRQTFQYVSQKAGTLTHKENFHQSWKEDMLGVSGRRMGLMKIDYTADEAVAIWEKKKKNVKLWSKWCVWVDRSLVCLCAFLTS